MKTIKHHYIAECYQKNFANDKGNVWVLDDNDRIFETNPKNLFKESHFYTAKGSLKGEETLSRIESEFSSTFRKVIAKQKMLDKSQKLAVAMFIASMLTRTKVYRRNWGKSIQDVLKMIDRIKEPVEKDPLAARDDGPIDPNVHAISIEEFEQAKNDMSTFHASSIMNTILEFSLFIYEMRWSFLVAPIGSTFICSDNPLHLCRPLAEKKYGRNSRESVAGLAHRDVELSIPISSSIAFFAGWENKLPEAYLTIQKHYVDQINVRTLRASSIIIADSKELLQNISSRKKSASNKC